MKKSRIRGAFSRRRQLLGGVALTVMAASIGIGQAIAQQNAGANTDLEEVVVTGIRGSLQQATERKKSLDVIVDVVTAEDIGKFPDQNLAESLQRISGIQITRNRGEGQNVSIRGLGPEFTRVQFNGRTLPSATGGRNFNFTILPSEFVSVLEVYKTPTADIEEGGLTGTVNIRTPRPLDIGKQTIVASLKGVHEVNSGDSKPAATILYTNTFGDGTFGIVLGAHYDKRAVESHIFEAFGLESGTENKRSPTPQLDYNLDGDFDDVIRFNHASNFSQLQEERERQTYLATLQWQPADNIDLWFEALRSEFDVTGAFPLNSFRWTNVRGRGVTASNIVEQTLDSDGLFADFLEIDGVDNRNNARTTDSNDVLTAISLGGTFQLEKWTLATELSYGKSKNTRTALSHEVIGRAHASYDVRVDPASIPQLAYASGFDPLKDANFRSLGFNGDLDRPIEDENIDFRLDVDRELNWGLRGFSFDGIKFGVKYSARQKFNGRRSLAVDTETLAGLLGESYDADIEGGSFDASAYLSEYDPSNFFDGASGGSTFPSTWLSADVATILAQVPLSTLLENGTLREGGARVIDVEEDVLSGYVKLNFSGANDKLSGNIGIRIVSTDQMSSGNIPDFSTVRFDQGGATTDVATSPSSVGRSYREILPSFNLRYEVTDDVVLRLAAARVMSRPSLDVLSPATTISVNTRSISSSNPDVDPFIADQIDVSLEWYLENGGLLAITPFVKFIESFVFSATQQEQVTYTEVNGGASQTQTFTRSLPDNGTGSDLYGFEINWVQPLDRLLPGLGILANFTFVSADDIQTAEDGPFLPLTGLSKTNYNLGAFYENDRFGARLAYNFRDSFVTDSRSHFGDGVFTGEFKQLDFSASYKVTKNIELAFEALNITDEVLVQTNVLGINRGLEDIGQRFTFGARAKF